MNLRAGGRNDSEANGPSPAVPGRGSIPDRELNLPSTEYVVESTHQPSNHGTGGQNADS